MNVIYKLVISFTLINNISLAAATALPIPDCCQGCGISGTTRIPSCRPCLRKNHGLCNEAGGYGTADDDTFKIFNNYQ